MGLDGRGCRNKGKRGEREVIDCLQPVVDRVYRAVGLDPVELKRNLLQAHKGGADVFGLDWMSMEVKRHENASGLQGWWRQCLKQTREGQTPILVWRQNHSPWRVRAKLPVKVGRRKLTMPVDITWEAFLLYFEMRLEYELSPAARIARSLGVDPIPAKTPPRAEGAHLIEAPAQPSPQIPAPWL